MKVKKEHIITGLIGLFTVSGAIAYWQYKKAMNYDFKVSLSKIKSISASLISFDIVVNFINKSVLGVHVISNKSDVYINDQFVTNVVNNTPFDVAPESTSKIPINVSFKPSDIKSLKINLADILLSPEKILIKVNTTLKIKFWGFNINLKDTTLFNLKELKELMSQNK